MLTACALKAASLATAAPFAGSEEGQSDRLVRKSPALGCFLLQSVEACTSVYTCSTLLGLLQIPDVDVWRL